MAKIKFDLVNNFTPVPEGERVLVITKAECKPSGRPSAMHVTFKDVKTGSILNNRYDFNSNGGLTAMAIMCRIALGLADMDEFDTVSDTPKLVGKKLVCEVVHNQGTQAREDGTYPIFANIKKVLRLTSTEEVATEMVKDVDIPANQENMSPRQRVIGNDLD